MENEVSKSRNTDTSESYEDSNLSKVLKEIDDIKEKIEQFNIKINNTI